MFFVSLFRVTRFAIQSFWRNIWLSVVTVTIIVLLLLSATTLVGLQEIGNAVLNAVSDRIDVSLYFNRGVTEENVLFIREQISQFAEVKSVEYISAESALQYFMDEHKNDMLVTDALDQLSQNPLGPVLQVQATDINSYDMLLQNIKTLNLTNLVEDIDFQDRRLLISRLNQLTQKATLVVTIVSTFFILISIMVVFNTIRLGIYSHREEVAIMKLVGATNWFTRMPFVFVGFLYALLSVVIFWILFIVVLNWLDPALSGFFSEISFSPRAFFLSNFWTIALQQLIGLTIINTLSTSIALRRYLHV